MDDLKHHILVYSGSLVSIHKLRHDLEEAGISVFIKDTAHTAASTGFVDFASAKLFILESEIEKATPIVNSFKERFKL